MLTSALYAFAPTVMSDLTSEKVGQDSYSIDDAPPNTGTNVEFEDYLYFAAVQRRAEDLLLHGATPEAEKVLKSNWFNRLSEHKGPNVNVNVQAIDNPIPPTADELERETASRALRLASWASVFYLITTDILGPFNAPFAISQTGWVPGTKFQLFSTFEFILIIFSKLEGIILYVISM